MKIFDINNDGITDSRDDFNQYLKIWINRKGDGVCRENDVYSLSTFGISLNLDFDKVFDEYIDSHLLRYKFTYSINYTNKNGKHIYRDNLIGYETALSSRKIQ